MQNSEDPTSKAGSTQNAAGAGPAPAETEAATAASAPVVVATRPPPPKKHPVRLIVGVVVVIVVLAVGIPWVIKSLNSVSTDDAFVNGHVTFVAARVPGQVARVLVDDNNRVHRGDLLVQLDREPLQVQLDIAQSAVAVAQSDLVAAQAEIRGEEGMTRSLRFNLEHTMEDVNNQIALLRSRVATLNSQKATLTKAQADYDRALPLVESGAITREEVDRRKESLLVSQARVEEALEGVYQIRVALGLPIKPETGDDLTQVPPDLDQTFSSVRQAQASLAQAAAQLGVWDSVDISPRQMVANFYKRDPKGNIDTIYAQLLKDAPGVKQAEAKLAKAQSNLDEAKLNLRYCDVVADIDGVVTRRNVNPGNNVIAGQSLMAIRSLTDIWIDANFKETQLASLRIGQPAEIDVDMYGSKQHFKGRVSGFTMGTGSTLALLPAENATGNFVKVVQRLPVRIDLVDYDPDKVPLFIGLSVTPTVSINEEPTGADAGKVLQPYLAMPPAGTQPAVSPPPTKAPETRP
jgi:membrane fusion protein (multidrug efflux system)